MQAPTLLNFTPIGTKYCNNFRNNNYLQFNRLHFKGRELTKDTFEPSINLSDKEKDYNEIKNSIKKENFIGAGFEGRVFKMEDPQYVVKIPKYFFNDKKINNIYLKKDLIEEEVTEQDKVNFIEKKYKNGIVIMKKISGEPLVNIKYKNKIANLPIKSYQKLLNQITDAYSKDMEFDHAMNNVLYDEKTNSLTAIDFRPYKDYRKKFNPLEKMYFVFDCFGQPHEKKISAKILSAGLNNLKSNADPEKSNLPYDFDEIIRLLQHNNREDWANIENIKSSIKTIKINKLNAETDYQLSQIDDYINYTNGLIKSTLCK